MRILLLLALLLSGCLEYEIVVKTVIAADGSAVRTVSIKARTDGGNAGDPWRRMRRPGDPYTLAGDEDEGFVATAKLRPGRHPSGLRILLGGFDDDERAEAERDAMPAAEGVADIRAVNLVVGTLYRYEERVALGTDPVRFREELPRWLDTALALLLEALKLRFPDVDFAPVEKHARAELLPAVRRAIENVHHAGTAMMAESAPLSLGAAGHPVTRSEFWPAFVREFAAFGVEMPKPGADLGMIELEESTFQPFLENLAGRLLAPLPEAQRDDVKAALLEGGLDAQLEEALEKLHPGEEARKKLGSDLASFASSALGGYTVYATFDSFDMRFRVELPGRLLRTNGDLSRLPAVEWRISKDDALALLPPVLYAYSFEPAAGVAPDAFDVTALAEIEEALKMLPPEGRAGVEVVVAGVLAGGARDESGLDEAAKTVCSRILDALAKAKPAEPPPPDPPK